VSVEDDPEWTPTRVPTEVPDRRTDFEAGGIGGAGARSKRQPGIQLAHAVSPGSVESEER